MNYKAIFFGWLGRAFGENKGRRTVTCLPTCLLPPDRSVTDAQLGLHGAARQAAAQSLDSSSLYGLTITLNSGSDRRPRMFVTQDAFTAGGLFSSAESSIKQVLIHELIHAAGAPGKDPGWWKHLGYDDLSFMQKQYDKILEACGGS